MSIVPFTVRFCIIVICALVSEFVVNDDDDDEFFLFILENSCREWGKLSQKNHKLQGQSVPPSH